VLLVALIVGALVSAVGLAVWSASTPASGIPPTLIFAEQVTGEEGHDPNPPADLLDQAGAAAARGGGELTLIHAAGRGGVQVGDKVPLRVEREPGQLENVDTTRQDAVRARVTDAFHADQQTPVTDAGRDVIGLIAAVAAGLTPGQNEVWIRTLGLGTTDPADARILMAADPGAAAESVAQFVPPLRSTRAHLILAPVAGDQPRFNEATNRWRREFMMALLHRAGATVVSVDEVRTAESPIPGAPAAPVIPSLPDPPTPRPPSPGCAPVARLDTSASFQADSVEYAISEQAVVAQLQPIIDGWTPCGYGRVEIVGHAARIGDAEGARRLSQRRADKVANVLRAHQISPITARGVGYDEPLPPDPKDPANRVVIVTAYPKN
jgi:outer membrane protein OmpA-like peptidoglycan-associated protein